ncbi:tyrosine-type recombinase/integrase [Heyndrickxia sporothermodurans]
MVRRGELSTEQKNLIKSKITDEEALKKFERDAHIRNLRPATIKFYKNELHAAKIAIEEMELNKQLVELTETDLENLILHLKAQIKTVSINTRIRALKSFYNYLNVNGLVKPNPIKNIKQLRDRQKIMETLEDEEIVLLANHMKESNTFVGYRDFVIFLLMLDTGIRLSETVGIEVEDLRKTSLIIRKTKNQKERPVYPSERVIAELRTYLKVRGKLNHEVMFVNIDNEPLKQRSIQSRFEKYRKDLKIYKKFSAHILRHTYAKRAVMNGMDAFTLAKLLGHSDITVTKRYVNLFAHDLEEMAKRHSTIGKLGI